MLQYRSQLPLLHTLLLSFVRRNELFTQPASAEMPVLADGSWQDPQTWRDAAGQLIQPVQKDPARDFLSRSILPGADIVALYAAQTPDQRLVLCLQLRGRVEPTLVYRLRISAFGAQGVRRLLARSGENLPPGEVPVVKSGRYACAQVGLSALGNPDWLFTGGDVEELGIDLVDQIAWQQVDLAPPVAGQ